MVDAGDLIEVAANYLHRAELSGAHQVGKSTSSKTDHLISWQGRIVS